MWNNLLWMLAIAAASPGAWAVTKCVGQGKTWYQDVPCPEGTAATPLQLDARPAAASPAEPEPADTGAAGPPTLPAAQTPSTPAPEPAPLAGAVPAVPSPLDRDAQACLDWYRRHVPLASGASYLNASRQGRVVTIVVSLPVSVRNPTGAQVQGTTQTPASCEIVNGRLDEGWTRTHARRGQWIP